MAKKPTKAEQELDSILASFLSGTLDAVATKQRVEISNGKLMVEGRKVAEFAVDPKYIKYRYPSMLSEYDTLVIDRLRAMSQGTHRLVATVFGD